MNGKDFDRLEVKRKILEASQNGKIPVLSYGHFEIINPYYVDSTLVEDLDDCPSLLTDELFFECLEESPDYLAYELFRKRIKVWQEILHRDATPDICKSNAKSQLEKVGRTLGWIGAGAPTKAPKDIDVEYFLLVEELEPFWERCGSLTLRQKKEAFVKAFPECIQYLSPGVLGKRSHKEIAVSLIHCKYKDQISLRKLRSLLKDSPFKP
jgi:hypothetical protein